MEFSSLESEVITWIQRNSKDPMLIEQLKNIIIKEREVTEEGIFIDLTFPKEFKTTQVKSNSKNPLPGPNMRNSDSGFSGKSLLFISEGLVSVLEIFAETGVFPKQHNDITLNLS